MVATTKSWPVLSAEVTPVEGFYVRSNFKLPELSAASHRVAVDGNVERQLQLGLDDLRALGTRTVTIRLTRGTWKYYCEPHESVMFGRFTVR